MQPVHCKGHSTIQSVRSRLLKPQQRFLRLEAASQQSQMFSLSQYTPEGPLVIAVDVTENSKEATEWSLDTLLREEQDVELVHVLSEDRGVGTEVGSIAGGSVLVSRDESEQFNFDHRKEYYERKSEQAYDQIQKLIGSVLVGRGVQYSVSLPRHRGVRSAAAIGETICTAAKESEAEDLIITSHGPGAMSDFGSVVRYCMQHFPGPVTVVPAAILERSCQEGLICIVAQSRRELELLVANAWPRIIQEGFKVRVVSTDEELTSEICKEVFGQYGFEDSDVDVIVELACMSTQGGGTDEGQGSGGEMEWEQAYDPVCKKINEQNAQMIVLVSYSQESIMQQMIYGSLQKQFVKTCQRPVYLYPPSLALPKAQ